MVQTYSDNCYQYEGLNLLRIDERYDGADEGSAINEGDPWRPINVFVHGPGQIGQIVRCSIYDGGSWVEDVYYHYDALGNVMGYTDSNANATTFEMDAFGNRIENSSTWETMTSIGPKEHLTGKMLDDDTSLYYFHARWYDARSGRFLSEDSATGMGYLFVDNDPVGYFDPDGHLKRPGKTPPSTWPSPNDGCNKQKWDWDPSKGAWRKGNEWVHWHPPDKKHPKGHWDHEDKRGNHWNEYPIETNGSCPRLTIAVELGLAGAALLAVATLVEDFCTCGLGIINDVPCGAVFIGIVAPGMIDEPPTTQEYQTFDCCSCSIPQHPLSKELMSCPANIGDVNLNGASGSCCGG